MVRRRSHTEFCHLISDAESSLYIRHYRAKEKQILKCIFSVYPVCIWATSVKITAGLLKHKTERRSS